MGKIITPTAGMANFYNVVSLATIAHGNTGATHTFDMTACWRHTATLDQACAITVTSPGVDCVCRIMLTAAAAWGVTFDAGSHLDHAANWANSDILTSVPIGRTEICLVWSGGEVNARYTSFGTYA